MAKQVQGSCNRCGHCGCGVLPDKSNEEWCPGIPVAIIDWYLMHPDPETRKFAAFIIDRMGYTKGDRGEFRINVPGIGIVRFWLSDEGVQVSETDRSCPFFALGTPNSCQLWGTEYLPLMCATLPQDFVDERHIAQFEQVHPHTSQGGTCGYYWIDV